MTALDAAIALLAFAQFGVFSRTQVLAAGGYDQLISRRLRSGAIEVRPGIYQLPGFESSYRQRLWVAHLALEQRAVVFQDAAARLHTFRGFPMQVVTFNLPHGQKRTTIDGVQVRQVSDLFAFPDHVMTMYGLPVTTPARTFADLAAKRCWSDRRLRDAFNDAWIRRIVTLDEQYRVLDDLRRPRKPGIDRMLRLLSHYQPDEMPPDSEIEQVFLGGCRQSGIEGVEMHAEHPGRDLPNSCVDGLVRLPLVIGEVDGRDAHARERDRARDAFRDRDAAKVGYLTVRWGYESVRHDLPGTMAEFAEVIEVRLRQLGHHAEATAHAQRVAEASAHGSRAITPPHAGNRGLTPPQEDGPGEERAG